MEQDIIFVIPKRKDQNIRKDYKNKTKMVSI